MNALLTFAVVLMSLCTVQTLTDDVKAKYQDLKKKCIEESGVENKVIMKARKKELTEDSKLMDYYYCFLKNLDIEDSDGKINVELFVSLFPVDKVEGTDALLKKCGDGAEGDTPSVIAYRAITCFIEKSEKAISF